MIGHAAADCTSPRLGQLRTCGPENIDSDLLNLLALSVKLARKTGSFNALPSPAPNLVSTIPRVPSAPPIPYCPEAVR